MFPDDVVYIGTAYDVPIPTDSLGMRLVVRRQALASAGTIPAVIDRIDAMLRALQQRIYRTVDLIWVLDLLWKGRDPEDRDLVRTCVSIIFPAQVHNICKQIDRQVRAGGYRFDNAVTEARLILPWFEPDAGERQQNIFTSTTYQRMEAIAVYVEEVIAAAIGTENRHKAIDAAAAIRFSIRVLQSE